MFAEIEYEGTAEEFLRQGMTPVRQMTIGPMFVGRKLEEIGWESVPMNDPRITAHPEWLENLQRWAGQDSQSFEIHETVRFERNADSWRAWLCHPMTYPEFQRSLLWELTHLLDVQYEWHGCLYWFLFLHVANQHEWFVDPIATFGNNC